MAKRKVAQVAAGGAELEAQPSLQKPPPSPLNPAHQQFAMHYARHGNGTVAYHFAYPKTTHRGSCASGAVDLLKRDDVITFIELLREQDRVAVNFSRQDYLRNLISIATDSSHKQQREANNDLYERLNLGEGSGQGNWFDGFERIAELVRATKEGKG
jgi:hypothetical protein